MATALKLFCLIFLAGGVFVLTQVFMPLISYQVWEWTALRENAPLITPLAQSQSSNGFLPTQVLGVSVAQANSDLLNNLPYATRTYKPAYDTFTLSIPKLKIEQAIVKVDSEDPDKSLILLPGMALPGEKGNVFIAGHSSYFRLFGPNSQYLSIFKELHLIRPGDEIIATVQGQSFKYRVKSMRVVEPTNLTVLQAPDTSGRYISLMTCVPPGTFMKRLIVLGELQ